jgi:hypothetical protein
VLGNALAHAAVGGEPRLPLGGTAPAQVTGGTHVSLDYEVTKVGPSGVGSVELWLTQDEGRTWKRHAEDLDLRPPFDVDLPGDGTYGLYLVVRSRSGLGRRPPQAGDLPQMRLEVDATPPAVQLFAPEPDARQRDALVLSWNARDRNLAPNPITVQWAERPDGPWQMISADLPNTGRYNWQLPANIPARVYLRLTARDAVGNNGASVTAQPVLIDLPEAQLIGLSGTTRRP